MSYLEEARAVHRSSSLTQVEITAMPQGTVKWFNSSKGFGFIKPNDGGQDLFVHQSETNGLTLNDGDLVEFEIGEGRKGPCAVKVKKI